MSGAVPPRARPAPPIAAVLAVVARGGRAILVRRANPPDAGLWGFPGGKVEAGETLAEAALRELREETGVEAEAAGVVTALDAFERAADGGLLRHFVMVAVLCRWRSGDPAAADDADEAAWFDLDLIAAGALPMSEGVQALARLAAERG